MNFPDDLKYTKEHEWILFNDDHTALVGITEFAVDQLGDIVHVDFPAEGDEIDAGDAFGTVESTKAVSDLYLPISGRVAGLNRKLTDNPEVIQTDPYGKGWIIKIDYDEGADSDPELLTAAEYEAFIAEED
jgi:glycine cleavage system H protein